VAALGSGASLVSVAAAATNPVIHDCVTGTLSRSYSVGELNQALSLLSPTDKEYTSCLDVIQQGLATAVAQRRTGGGGGGSRSGSGAFLPAPVIIILVALVLVAVTLGAVAIRRRRLDDEP
jgi:hypothetical protein